jgi:hypothetical protein
MLRGEAYTTGTETKYIFQGGVIVCTSTLRTATAGISNKLPEMA